MKKVVFIGKPFHINYEKQTISFSFDYIDPDIFLLVEEIIKNKYFCKIRISYNDEKIISDSKRKAWFGSIATILKHRGIVPTSEIVYTAHKHYSESIFPVKMVDVGLGELVPDITSIKNLTDEELGNAIHNLQERYSDIDWEQFKE